MDLSQITKQIYAATATGKTATVAGTTYTFKLQSMEHQKVIDALFASSAHLEEGTEERQAASQEVTVRSIMYALESINGEIVPDVFPGNKHRDIALYEAIKTWPDTITDVLFRIVLNMRVECASKLAKSVEYEWFGIEGFDTTPTDSIVEELAVEDEKSSGDTQIS